MTDNGETGAYTYVADESAVDDSLRPYSLQRISCGRGETTFITRRIAQLERVDADPDPDAEREMVKSRITFRRITRLMLATFQAQTLNQFLPQLIGAQFQF